MPERRDTKALRLATTGAVRFLSADAAQVQGDHGVYVADRLTGEWRCNCPFGARRTGGLVCSHILAAALVDALATNGEARAS